MNPANEKFKQELSDWLRGRNDCSDIAVAVVFGAYNQNDVSFLTNEVREVILLRLAAHMGQAVVQLTEAHKLTARDTENIK